MIEQQLFDRRLPIAVIHRFPFSRTARSLVLALLPYLLCLGVTGITLLLLWLELPAVELLWSVMRWSLRFVIIAGAYLGWRQTAPDQRPLWWYGWLGFATYEGVALLLMAVFGLMRALTQFSASLGLLALPMGALAFLPYLVVATVVARYEQRWALFTVFPHAALTVPLFLLALARMLGATLDSMLFALLPLPLFVASVVVSILIGLRRAERRSWLYGGMAVSQLAFAASLAFNESNAFLLLLALPLMVLGACILSGPLLLLPLWQFMVHLIERLGGQALLQQMQQGLQARSRRLAASAWSSNRTGGPQVAPALIQQQTGDFSMSEMATPPPAISAAPTPGVGPGLERLYKLATVLLAAVIIGGLILFVGRSAVYKIHEYERGLHLRGGRFLAVQGPGWHLQIPLVDTVIIVKVNERLGYVERIEAMTSDNVTMFVSLQYTFRVTDPQQFALQVDDPERIVFEFVQGRLRDVVNTKAMAAVMNDRALMNEEVMAALKEKESQYGVQFATVQLQSASPPDEVLTAIKDRMVAGQRQEQAQAEAAQQKTVADAEFYTAQKRAEAAAYEITKTAEAEAERIRLNTEVQQLAIRSIVGELEGKGDLANKFIDYLIAQELKNNSKWIINGEGTPIVDLK